MLSVQTSSLLLGFCSAVVVVVREDAIAVRLNIKVATSIIL